MPSQFGLLISLFGCMATPLAAVADYISFRDNADQLGVRFVQYDATFSKKNSALDSTIKQISIGWREAFGDRIRAGLFGGSSYLSQDDNAATAGEQLEGWHGGIQFDATLYRGERLTMTSGGQYLYQRADEDGLAAPVEFEWSETTIYLGVASRVVSGLTLFGGGNYMWLDGEQRVGGASPSTTRFDHAKAGGFAGIDLELDVRGHIGIVAETGARKGGQIYFLRRF